MNLWILLYFFFFSSRRRHTRSDRDWSSDVCSSDLVSTIFPLLSPAPGGTVARTVTVADSPTRIRTDDGVTEPNGTSFDTDAVNDTLPVVPCAEAAIPRITAVHAPACGRMT